MGSMKTPGVYIIEKNAFPNSVVEAPTAIPAFIGYTKQAVNGNNDLKNVPWKISSMTEYIQYFGGGPDLKFEVDIKDGSLCIEGKTVIHYTTTCCCFLLMVVVPATLFQLAVMRML